jgi:hypothetical protein
MVWGGESIGHCSGWCQDDADCPTDMLCVYIEPCANDMCTSRLPGGACRWLPGSRTECGSDADCPDGEVCKYFTPVGGGVEQMCASENCDPDGADCLGLGEECGEGLPPCWTAYCFGGSQGQYCSATCETSADCEGTACVTLQVNSIETAGACWLIDGSGDVCTSSADCSGGETCQYWALHAGIELICAAPGTGGGVIGDSCSSGEDCADKLCFTFASGQSCTQICDTDLDCPLGYLCGGFNFQDHPEQRYSACMPLDGSGQACTSDAGCPAGEACTYFLRREGADSVCMTANDPAGQAGDECGAGLPECYNNMCITTYQGSACAAVCSTDADCPADFVCVYFSYQGDETRYPICAIRWEGSAQACSLDSDCPAGEVCGLLERVDGFEFVCRTRIDPGGDVGDECGAGLPECYNNLCFMDPLHVFCTAWCQSNADCPAGTVCGVVRLPGDPVEHGICAPLFGSQTPCTNNADCTVAGEACLFYHELNGPVEGHCSEAAPGGADPGVACTENIDCTNLNCLDDGYCTSYCETNADCAVYGLECAFNLWPSGFESSACLQPGADSPLCSFCLIDADCIGADAKCIASVANPGELYCGKPCAGAADCPAGTSCVDVGGGVLNCKPDTDTCW